MLSVKVVPYTQGVPGSHWGIPGGLGGAPSGRSSVPTAMDGSDAVSRRGKRVKYLLFVKEQRNIIEMGGSRDLHRSALR